MVKVLVADADVQQNAKCCQFLANDKELEITSTTDGLTTLNTYFEMKPNILILSSNFNDIKYTDILNKLSTAQDENNKCNTILTTNVIDEQLYSVYMTKVFRIVKSSLDFDELAESMNYLKNRTKYIDLTENELNILFIKLGISLHSDGADYLKCALYHCYYYPKSLNKLENIFDVVANQYSTTKDTIRNKIRTSLKQLRISKEINEKSLLRLLEKDNITPKYFLEVCSTYLYSTKNKK